MIVIQKQIKPYITKSKKVNNMLVVQTKKFVQDIKIGSKAQKEESLNKLTITTSLGKVFYADPKSRGDLADAIALANEENKTKALWKLAEPFKGKRVVEVKLSELKEARKLALEAKGSIVGVV